MSRRPQAANRIVELQPGVSALAPGVLWLHRSRAIVAADVHFGYEDVIGGALPLWSIAELTSTLLLAVQSMQARELVLLGDAIHGSRMNEGAAAQLRAALSALRALTELTIVAGNHEGRSRGVNLLGETVEQAERDGWLLLHGDRPPRVPQRSIIGHLHPSLPVGPGTSVPAFLAGKHVLVLPALTPYSSGLNVYSDACLHALRPFNVASRGEVHVVGVTAESCYPFGTLSALRKIAVEK